MLREVHFSISRFFTTLSTEAVYNQLSGFTKNKVNFLVITAQQDGLMMPKERVSVARMATVKPHVWPSTHSIGVPWNGRCRTIITRTE